MIMSLQCSRTRSSATGAVTSRLGARKASGVRWGQGRSGREGDVGMDYYSTWYTCGGSYPYDPTKNITIARATTANDSQP